MKRTSAGTPASRPRPDSDRPLEAPLLPFDLATISKRIKNEADWATYNHNAITLIKNAGMRVVLIAMNEGNKVKMHLSDGEISVHVTEGQLEFNNAAGSVVLTKGQLLALQADTRYELVASRVTTFLLTMTNVGSNDGRIF
jgi:quercetin dioxygenase-like cupin family protein